MLAENLGKTILLIVDVRGHRDQILVFQRLMDYKRNLPLKNCPLSPEKVRNLFKSDELKPLVSTYG